MALHIMDEANRCLQCKVPAVSEGVSDSHQHSAGNSPVKRKQIKRSRKNAF